MEYFIVFIIAVIICVLTWKNTKKDNKYGCKDNLAEITLLGGIIIGVLLCVVYEYGDIQPLDVYRGKTELRIKGYYQDSNFVITDSVVMFKKE